MTSIALLLALAGCGDDDTTPEPTLDPSPTAESSASEPTDPESSEPAEPFDAEGGELHRGTVKADSEAERAIADAWFAYWEVRLQAYHEADVDADALGAVGRGEAVTEVVDYVAQLQQDGDHIVGDTRIGISKVEIRGEFAAVMSCFEGKGHLAGTPPYDEVSVTPIVGTLTKVGQEWIVESQVGTGEKTCKA